MSYTKRQFVEEAYAELGISDFAYDLEPEQLQRALKRLDAMMSTWNAEGVRLGYPIPSNPEDSDLDDSTNVPDSANEAIILNLAIKIAPGFGKAVSLDTRTCASRAYKALLNQIVKVPIMTYDRTIAGAGHKVNAINDSPFLNPSDDSIQTGNDGNLDI